jgi:hypothetical protein
MFEPARDQDDDVLHEGRSVSARREGKSTIAPFRRRAAHR